MILSNLIRLLRQWFRYHKNVRELSQLGERELADIGICRSEIAAVAWAHAKSRARIR
jgi:uncharacterized protein YjiS (DUF1127 family)